MHHRSIKNNAIVQERIEPKLYDGAITSSKQYQSLPWGHAIGVPSSTKNIQ